MEVGERYIIEISDVIATNNGNLAKIKGFNALVFDENGLSKLEQIERSSIVIPPKEEPHEPKEGDVYLDIFGHAFMIFNVTETKCQKMYDDGSGDKIEIEELKTRKHVGNIKADLEALQRVVGSYE